MDLSPADIVIALEHVQLFQYIDVASIAILIFDYFLTLDMEILYIWPSRWSGMKCMFLITRYLPIFESALLLSRTFSSDISIKTCDMAYRANTILILVGIVIAEIILSMRTWAVWGKDRKIGVGLLIFSLASAIPAIPVILHFSNTAQFVNPPLPHYRGCFLVGGSRILSIDWILLMGYDAGLLILMGIQAIRSRALSDARNSSLLSKILRDGIIYYFYLFVLSSFNVLVIWKLPPDFINLLSMFERVIHALLTCRVVLQMRQQAAIPLQSLCRETMSTVEFNDRQQQRSETSFA